MLMKRLRNPVIAVAVALIVAACLPTFVSSTMRGGGWIPSYFDENARATFGFSLACNTKTNKISGQFQYVDHGIDPNLAIHGFISPFSVTELEFDTCADLAAAAAQGFELDPGQAIASGPYKPQVDGVDTNCKTNPTACGQFVVFAADNTTSPCSGGDAIALELIGGLYSGYENEGCLNGGNITIKI
jgi:hypothetical protein